MRRGPEPFSAPGLYNLQLLGLNLDVLQDLRSEAPKSIDIDTDSSIDIGTDVDIDRNVTIDVHSTGVDIDNTDIGPNTITPSHTLPSRNQAGTSSVNALLGPYLRLRGVYLGAVLGSMSISGMYLKPSEVPLRNSDPKISSKIPLRLKPCLSCSLALPDSRVQPTTGANPKVMVAPTSKSAWKQKRAPDRTAILCVLSSSLLVNYNYGRLHGKPTHISVVEALTPVPSTLHAPDSLPAPVLTMLEGKPRAIFIQRILPILVFPQLQQFDQSSATSFDPCQSSTRES